MKIVNPNLPRGDRALNKQYSDMLKPLLNMDSIIAYKALSDAWNNVPNLSSDLSWQQLFMNTLEIIKGTDPKYPAVTFNPVQLRYVSPMFAPKPCTKKEHYASDWQVGDTGMFYEADNTMILQYSPKHDRVLIKDVPYQGELVNNSPMIINKKLKGELGDIIKTLCVSALLQDTGDVYYIPSHINIRGIERDHTQLIKHNLINLFDGSMDEEDIVEAIICLRMARAHLAGNRYAIRLDHMHTENMEISAATRTNLIYRLGGYNLPDNYEDWFAN